MTRRDFEKLHQLNRERMIIEEAIAKYKSYAKSKVKTYLPVNKDIPKANDAVERVEQLEKDLVNRKYEIEKLKSAIDGYINRIDDVITREIFNLRCIGGYQWGEVAEMLGGSNTPENVRKRFSREIFKRNIQEKYLSCHTMSH